MSATETQTTLDNRILDYLRQHHCLQDGPDEVVVQLIPDETLAERLGVDAGAVTESLYAMADGGRIWWDGNANYGPIVGWFLSGGGE